MFLWLCVYVYVWEHDVSQSDLVSEVNKPNTIHLYTKWLLLISME